MVAKADTKRKKGPGRPPKAAAVKINNIPATDDLLAMYKDMLLIRRFEEKAGQLYGMGQIGGFAISISGKKRLLSGCNRRQNPAIRWSPLIVIMVTCWHVAWRRTG